MISLKSVDGIGQDAVCGFDSQRSFWRLISALGLAIVFSSVLLIWLFVDAKVLVADGKILYVAKSGVDNALCSPTLPCETLQHALTQASPGDEIRVAKGIYTGVGSAVITITKDIAIGGGFTTTNWLQPDPNVNSTIIDGENQRRVVYISSESKVIISGVHIQQGLVTDTNGAGIYNPQGNLTLENSWVYSNTTVKVDPIAEPKGGGIASGFANADAELMLLDSAFYGNQSYIGAAVSVITGTAIIERNTIFDNSADFGSIALDGGHTEIRNNQIHGNHAAQHAGAIAVTTDAILELKNGTIYSNTTGGNGGGIWIANGDVAITNTLIISNTASAGGAIYGLPTSVAYTDFYGNDPAYTPSGTNRTENPDFVDPANGDLHLSADSPAIDSGTSLPDVTTDIDGNGRPFDGGWDRGADEYTASSDCYARIADDRVYTDVQTAVDAAVLGDTVQIAGTCVGATPRGGVTQTVYLSKSLTLRGGYTVTDWTTPQYGPTVLDAQGQGRGLYVTGDVSTTLENLYLTNGVAVQGGGLYLGSDVEATVVNNVFYANAAAQRGGALVNLGRVNLQHNTIYSNTATLSGGALYHGAGEMTLENNVLYANAATSGGAVAISEGAMDFSADYNAFDSNSPDNYGDAEPGPHDRNVPPAFEDAVNGDVHLSLDSALVNAADPASSASRDFEADPRPWVSRADIGADERLFHAAVELSAGQPDATRIIEPAGFDDIVGQPVTFTHMFTNTGYTRGLTDTFDVEVANPAGWTVTPHSTLSDVALNIGETHTFSVVVTVPTDVDPGFYNRTLVTVTSQTSAGAYDTAVDTIANPGVEITPVYNENADPGEVLTYTHVVTNIGPMDTFTLTYDSPQRWGSIITPVVEAPFTATLANGDALTLAIEVEVPETAPVNLVDAMPVWATSSRFVYTAKITDTTKANATTGDRFVTAGAQGEDDTNCTSPTDPCRTVEHAYFQTLPNDTIKIAAGSYAPTGTLLLNQNITLLGGFTYQDEEFVAPEEANPAATVLDFGGLRRGVRIRASEVTLQYFTIERAYSPARGGGISIEDNATAHLHHLRLMDTQGSLGGAVYVESGTTDIEDVVISDTVATGGGGALYNAGGNVIADGLTIRGGTAGAEGGGVYNENDLTLKNTFVISSVAEAGGGIYNTGVLRLYNGTLFGNDAATYGGGLFDDQSSELIISNTLVVSNTAPTGSGLYRDSGGLLQTDYNNVWGNQSNIPAGSHDLSVDPLFVDPVGGDLRLTFESPCMDVGDPNTTLTTDFEGDIRPSNQGYDMGADEVGGCLARVAVPNPNPDADTPYIAVSDDVFGSVQEAVDAADPDQFVQVAGICRGAQPRFVDGSVLSQTVLITKNLTLLGGYSPTFEEPDPESPEPTYLDALGLGRVLVVAQPTTETVSVAVSRMKLQGGDAGAERGGGVYLHSGELTLDALTVAGNRAAEGGGLYNEAGRLTLAAVEAVTNTASLSGGGFYNGPLAETVTISPTHFISNTAGTHGGGLYNAGALDLRASTVISNVAERGGGLYNTDVLTLVNTLVVSNTASADGGGLYNDAETLVVRHDTFFGNLAADQGGGIYHDASTSEPLINSTLIISNTAGASLGGGGIFSAGSDPNFGYNALFGNAPGSYGGNLQAGDGVETLPPADPQFISLDPASPDFLHLAESSPAEDTGDPTSPIMVDIDGAPRPSNQGFDIGADEIGDCYVRINGLEPTYGSVQRAIDDALSGDTLFVAGTCKGAPPVNEGGAMLYQTAFFSKTLSVRGGYTPDNWEEPKPSVYTTTLDALSLGRTVYVTNSAVVSMTGLLLQNGAADHGGAIYVGDGVFTLTQSTVATSTAELGGGLYNAGAQLYVVGETRIHSNAADDGGAVYAAGGSTYLGGESVYVTNSATRGAGIFHAGGDLLLDGALIHDNTATGEGGGVYHQSGAATLQNTMLYRNTAVQGGGLYAETGSALTVDFNTFYANTADEGGGFYTVDAAPVVRNTIFATNTATTGDAIYSAQSGYTTDGYNDIYPWSDAYAHATDIGVEPGFVDAVSGDLRLRDDSPLLDRADPDAALLHDLEGHLRPADQGFDIGADERYGCWARVVRGSDADQEIYGPYGNPQRAIAQSIEGDVIEVTVGDCLGVHVYDGISQTVHITHPLTLKGGYTRDFTSSYDNATYPDLEEATAFHPQGAGRALLIATEAVTVENVSLVEGDAAEGGGNGGGLFFTVNPAMATLSQVDFYTNTATSGGALYQPGGTLVIENSVMAYNEATYGGALYQAGGALTVTLESEFLDNTADQHGGALFVDGGARAALLAAADQLQLWGRNTAERGGAIYNNDNGYATIDYNSLFENQADQTGGAIYNRGDMIVEHATIHENQAARGAGLYAPSGANTTVDLGTKFYLNVGSSQGGAIYNDGNTLTLQNTLIYTNTAPSGGGVYLAGGSSDVVHNTFYLNAAGTRGGAVYVAGGTPTIQGNIFDRNEALEAGTAIYDDGGATLGYNDFWPNPDTVQVQGPDRELSGESFNDPAQYVDELAYNFHLSEESPLIDIAETGRPDYDMDGIPRPVNLLRDVGADEYEECLVKNAGTGELYGRIQQALDEAESDPDNPITLHVAYGVCYESLTIDQDVNIVGSWKKDFSEQVEGCSPVTYVDARDEEDRVATLSGNISVDVSRVTFQNGDTTGLVSQDGGGLYVGSAVELALDKCAVSHCTAERYGGGVYNAGIIDLGNTDLDDNVAGSHGGGLYVASGVAYVSGHGASGNRSGGSGGGIYVADGAVFGSGDYSGSWNYGFSGNVASGVGGGLYNSTDNAILTNLGFSNNSATEGAGLYNTGDDVTIWHMTNRLNDADTRGGALRNDGAGLAIRASIIASNSAPEAPGISGGAVVAHSLCWDNACDTWTGTDNIEADPQFNWLWAGLHYTSPAIDTVPGDASDVPVDTSNNGRPQICIRDRGYQEYVVGKRELAWGDSLAERWLLPGEVFTQTFSFVNDSEHWIFEDDEDSSLGPGTGYTETMEINLAGTQDWAVIGDVEGVSGLSLSDEQATFDVGPGDRATIHVRITIPPTQTASFEDDPATYEELSLDYAASWGCTDTEDPTPPSGERAMTVYVAKNRAFEIGPDNNGSAQPGETLTYTHVLTHQGNFTGTYTVSPKAGFYGVGEIISPTATPPFEMGPWSTRTVTIAVTINLEAAAGLTDTTYAVASLKADNEDEEIVVRSGANNTRVEGISGIRYVAPNGQDSLVNEITGDEAGAVNVPDNNCTQPETAGPCRTLQHALSQALSGGEIRMATGTYSDTITRTVGAGQVITQMAYINQDVTIQGGYVTTDWEADPPDHPAHPTVLQPAAGRALYVASGDVTLERLTLADGDASGHGGGPSDEDAGGNLYNAGATLTLNALDVQGGRATLGAGLYHGGGDLTLTNSLIRSNGNYLSEAGGGLYVLGNAVTVLNNTFSANEVTNDGGALYADGGTWSLINNVLLDTESGVTENPGSHAAVHVEAGTTFSADYNLYWNNSLADVSGVASKGGNVVESNPDLDGSLYPSSGSPVRDAGDPATDLGLVPQDYANNPRLQGSQVDIGAYEYEVVPQFALGPDYERTVDPGTETVYRHTLTNTGEMSDTYDLSVMADWTVDVAPAMVQNLAPGMTATVWVTVTVPAGAAGQEDVATIIATSQGAGNPSETATDRTFARLTPGVEIVPDNEGRTRPGELFGYTHTVTNTGNGPDTFTVTHQAPTGWTVTHADTLALNADETTVLDVTITPPVQVLSGTVVPVTVTVTSAYSEAVDASAVNTTTIERVRDLVFASDEAQEITTETAVTYTHSLANMGNYTDTFDFNWASTQTWGQTLVEPTDPVDIGPWATQPVTFALTNIPPNSGGLQDVTIITATIAGTTIEDNVEDTTSVLPDYNFVLTPASDQQVTTAPNIVSYTHILTNTGNVADAYNLVAENSEIGWPDADVSPASIDNLAPDAQETIIVTVTVPADATATNVTTLTVTSLNDPVGLARQALDTTLVEGPADLTISKTASPVDPAPGDEILYTLTVTNTGEGAFAVEITDVLPDQVAYQSADFVAPAHGTVQSSGQTVTWALDGELATDASAQVTVTGQIISPLADGTLLVNTYDVTADNDPEGDSDTLTTEVQATDLITLSKLVTPTQVRGGDTVTYTLTLTNTGNGVPTVEITDTLATGFNPPTFTTTRVITGEGGTATVVFTAMAPAANGTYYNEAVTATHAVEALVETAPITVTGPAWGIAKTVVPEGPVQPGDALTYTLTVTNVGQVATLGAYTLTDELPEHTHFVDASVGGGLDAGIITWARSDSLDPGEAFTHTFVVTVTRPLTDGVAITNDVYSIEGGDAPRVNGAPVTISVNAPAALSLSKVSSDDAPAPGDIITYTLTVTNTDTEATYGPALNVVITDALPSDVFYQRMGFVGGVTGTTDDSGSPLVWTLDDPLTVGASAQVTVAGRVNSPLANGTLLTNTVGVTADNDPAGGTAAHVAAVAATNAITLSKSVTPSYVLGGGVVTYTVTLTNSGTGIAQVALTDTLEAGFTPSVYTETVTVPGHGWGAEANAETVAFTAQAPVTEGMYANPVVTATYETESLALMNTAPVTVVQPYVTVGKMAAPDPVQADAELVYTIRVTNTGEVSLTDVVITDTLPGTVMPTGVQTWSVPYHLEPGEVYSLTLPVTVGWGYSGTLTNEVAVSTAEGATDVYSMTSLAQVTPAVEVEKRVDPPTVEAGDPLTYTITMTNTGNISLTPTVTDTLPGAVTPNDPLTWTPVLTEANRVWQETVVVTAAWGYSGTLENRVEVTAPEGNLYEDATVTSGVVTEPALEIAKQVEPDDVVRAGGTVTYSLAVTNTGSADLNAVITDTLPTHVTPVTPTGVLTWTAALTEPNAVWTEQFTATVDADYAGLLVNGMEVRTAEGVSDMTGVAVTAEIPITGLDAQNDSPTPLDEPTTLTATVDAGSNITYAWAFGDGHTGRGPVITHLYSAVGTYTAVVTATNAVDVITATTMVTITDVPITGLQVFNDSPTVLGRMTTLTAAVGSGSRVTYTWAFGDGQSAIDRPALANGGDVITHTYGMIGTYTATVTATNALNQQVATTEVTIVEAPTYVVYLPLVMRTYTSNAPDLVVTDVTAELQGDEYRISVTVQNQGPLPVEYGNNFYVDLYIDREPTALLPGDVSWGAQGEWFGIGESRVFVTETLTLDPGIHQLYAQVDTDNTVIEANEGNNRYGPVTVEVPGVQQLDEPERESPTPLPGPRPTPTARP